MAGAASILGMIGKGSPGAAPAGGAAPGGESPLGKKAAALKSMWGNMKTGDFEAAAMDFHDAYEACEEAKEEESLDDSSPAMDFGDESDEEM